MKNRLKISLIPRNIKIAFVLFLFVHLSSLLYVPLFIDKDIYNRYVMNKLSNLIDYRVTFKSFSFSLFPQLSLEFLDFHLTDPEYFHIEYVRTDKVKVVLAWKAFFKLDKFIFTEVVVEGGLVDVNNFVKQYTNPNEDKKDKNTDGKTSISAEDVLTQIENYLEVDSVKIKNMKIYLTEVTSHVQDTIVVNDLSLKFPSFKNIDFVLNGKYMNGSIYSKTNFGLDSSDLSFEKMTIDTETKINSISLKQVEMYLSLPKNILIGNSQASINLKVFKPLGESRIELSGSVYLDQFLYLNSQKKLSPIIPINFNFTNLSFDYTTKQIETTTVNAKIGEMLDGEAKFQLSYSVPFKIVSSINLKSLNIDPILQFLDSFSSDDQQAKKEHSQKQFPIYLLSKFHSDRISYQKYTLYNTNIGLKLLDTNAEIDLYNTSIFNGTISGSGLLKTNKGLDLVFDLNIKNIDMNTLTTTLMEKKLLEGSMNSLLRIKTFGNTPIEIKKNLFSIGQVKLQEGILFDKANFLKPVFSLDKIISIQKTETNFSKYNSIDFEYIIENSNLSVKNFHFSGMGLKAEGYANVESDQKVDARIIVQFGGFAGKALKIPIVYNSEGILPFEIDKMWMASVYAGTIFLAGPAGAILGTAGVAGTVAGGLAGSAASENVDSSWEKIKSLFKKE